MDTWVLVIGFCIIVSHFSFCKAVSSVIGSTITLKCPLLPTQTQKVIWFKATNTLSYGDLVLPDLLPEEFRDRLSIAFDNGKYHLTISDLKKTDEGQYQCIVGGTLDPYQTLAVVDVSFSRAVSAIVGSTVTLHCPLHPTGSFKVTWAKESQLLSHGESILSGLQPDELRNRLSITMNDGKYHLKISSLVKADEGQYQCLMGGTVDPFQKLTIIVGPTDVRLENKNGDGNLQGTEGQDLRIRCIAVGGDPRPDVVIQIGTNGPEITGTGGAAEHTILGIARSFDGTVATCRTDYPGVVYESLTDSSIIYLNLKPLSPTFSPDPISTEDTKPLVLTCTSTGSRPAPTHRIWLLGDRNTDITSSSTAVVTSLDPSYSDTYITTSTLTYVMKKQYNGKNITCGFTNIITGNMFIKSSIQIDVKYAPEITVQNKTFEPNEINRELQCILNGNPNIFTFNKWEHRSKYGQHIRYLNAAKTQTLPVVSQAIRYQDIGEYICTANNGILNSQNQLDQKGSGYVVSKAQPFFLKGNYETKLSQENKDVEINVDVYSEPQFTSVTWYKDGNPILPGSKHSFSNSPVIVNEIFHGVNVQVDGYRLVLTIRNLQENDFTNYIVRISNGVGETVEHMVVLKSVGSPDSPTDFSVTNSKTNSITVRWKPGFDGRSEQSFVLQYRRIGTNQWTSRKIKNAPIGPQEDGFDFTLDGLNEGTFYALRMYAENIFNSSSYTEVLEIFTSQDEKLCIPQSVVAGVAGGLSSVIILLIGVIAVLLCRRSSFNQAKSNSQRKETTQQHYMDVSEDEENVSPFMQSEPERNKTSPGQVSEYEEMGLRDQPNLYSEMKNVDEQKETDKTSSRQMSGYEELGLKDQPNVYSQVDSASEQKDKDEQLYSN